MQHLGGGQHWSGQGILEGLCAGAPRFGAFNENNYAEDAFTKLLANFEAQELAHLESPDLPSTGHQISTLTPFSRRQRKSCRPLRVPPTFETAQPLRDNIKACFQEGCLVVEPQLAPSVKNCSIKSFFKAEDKRNLEPVSPTPKSAPHLEKFLQNRMNNDHSRPANLDFQGVITQQDNVLDTRNPPPGSRYAQISGKLSNGASNHGTAALSFLPSLQRMATKFDSHNGSVCRNNACQAKISSEASFCRRCSCSICKLFDNERDPSLWIQCDPALAGGCGLSCHIECALKQQVAGVVVSTDDKVPSLDGNFYCNSCHSIMPLVCCWRDQLLAARDAPTLDILYYRLFLSYRLLKGTKLYGDIFCPIKEAMKRVNAEISQMAPGSEKSLRCSMDLLSCKRDVQKLITLALEKVDARNLLIMESMEQAGQNVLPFMVCFEDVSSYSIVVAVNVRRTSIKQKLLGYRLWHRKASELAYSQTPTGILYNMDDKCVVSNLDPVTDYIFKVVPFSMEGDLAICEAGCFTKDAGHAEQPVDVYTSLDVVVINAERVDGGISKSINQSFKLDCHVGNGKNGLKLQDLEEVSADQTEEGHHLSPTPPVDDIIQKSKCDSYTNVVSVYSKRGTHVKDERRRQPAKGDASREQEERKLKYMPTLLGNSESKKMQTGTKDVSMKNSSYSSFEGWDHGRSRKRLKNGINKHFISDSKQSHHNGSSKDLCMSNHKILSQNWRSQSDAGDKNVAIQASKRVEMQLDDGSDHHMQGIFTCDSEADFQHYEFSVKVIRWLECKGHLKEEFRMKFLTWFTLRASEQEKRVISVFIDTLQDDPVSLAGQLVDAFEELIGIRECQGPMEGFCRRLW